MSNTKVTGTADVIRRLRKMNDDMLGVVSEPALQELMVRRVLGRFDAGVAPDGSPWPGLLGSTLRRKGKGQFSQPSKLLYRTGRLRNSIRAIQGTNRGLLASNTGLGFRIGVSDPKAAYYGRLHNYGVGGQVKRQFIGLSKLDSLSVTSYMARRLKSIANRA